MYATLLGTTASSIGIVHTYVPIYIVRAGLAEDDSENPK